MGRVLLVGRLAARNLRRRPAEAALLAGGDDGGHHRVDPRARPARGDRRPLRETPGRPRPGPTSWPAFARDPFIGQPADLAGLEALADAPGVIDHSGPYPVIGVELEADGVTGSRRTPRGEEVGGAAGVWAVGRDPAAAPVDQPELTQGSWVRDGGAVVEAGFADALGVGEGDQITLRTRVCTLDDATSQTTLSRRERPLVRSRRCGGHRRGAAVSGCLLRLGLPRVRRGDGRSQPQGPPPDEPPPDEADDERFMEDPVEPGLVWLTEADARGLAPDEEALSYVVNLKLADPTDAPAFVNGPLLDDGRTGPADVAGHPRPARPAGAGHAGRPADRQPAARHTRRGQRRGPRRRPDGRPDPTRRTAQSGRRHTAAWSQPCCSPSMSSWPCSRPRPGWRPDGWPPPCSPIPAPASWAAPVRRRSPCPRPVR